MRIDQVTEKKKSPAGGPACWKGKKIHPTKPTKMKGGKRVNNCIDAGTKESVDDCDHTCPKSCPDCGGTGKAKKKMDESGTYIGNCTQDETVDNIFGDVSEFARQVEMHGDEFEIDNLVVKYDPEEDIHHFYIKESVDITNESYPMGMDPDNNTNVSFNQTKKIGDATLNIHAEAPDMEELRKVLQMAGLDPDGAEKHMPEPDSVQVVSVDPMPNTSSDDTKYNTDKNTLIDVLRSKLQAKL